MVKVSLLPKAATFVNFCTDFIVNAQQTSLGFGRDGTQYSLLLGIWLDDAVANLQK